MIPAIDLVESMAESPFRLNLGCHSTVDAKVFLKGRLQAFGVRPSSVWSSSVRRTVVSTCVKTTNQADTKKKRASELALKFVS